MDHLFIHRGHVLRRLDTIRITTLLQQRFEPELPPRTTRKFTIKKLQSPWTVEAFANQESTVLL